MFYGSHDLTAIINTKKTNKSRARFACRIRITRFREFVSFSKLDGDYASPYPQSSFSDIPLTRSDAENVFWLLESQRRVRTLLQSGGNEERKTAKKGRRTKIDTSSLWWTSKDSNYVHEGMGNGIPIKIARMSTRRKLRKVWSTGESCPSVYGFLK